MPKKTLFAAAITAAVLAVGGSLAFAAPAFADPTPAPDPTTTISNVAVGIDNSAGRQVHIQYNFTIADPTLDGDSIVEVTDFDSCDTPTVIDRDVPLASPGGGISLYVVVPATGFVKVQIYSSNGAAAPLVTAPVFASDAAVTPTDFIASIAPDPSPLTGVVSVNTGNSAPIVHYELEGNGVPIGAPFAVDGCAAQSENYSAAAGTVLTVHVVDGDFDAATFTIPGGDPAPADPGAPTLPTTGVGPGSWYAGGLGLAALVVGAVLLIVHWRMRRRRVAALR